MRKRFNIAGPCLADRHYMLPALARSPELVDFVESGEYFVVHAARQSGKTTAMLALVDEINARGAMNALYFTVESAQPYSSPEEGIPVVVRAMASDLLSDERFSAVIPVDATGEVDGAWSRQIGVERFFMHLSKESKKPLAIFIDEIDALSDGTLIAFLRQLRSGYITRARIPFPASIALVGMRNIRDYKAQVRSDSHALGSASPFNIVSEVLTLRNFTEDEVRQLYAQHTEATGQVFQSDAVVEAYRLTCGQPWLVNAIARECVEKIHGYRYDEPITFDDIGTAKETLIRARGTHVDSLMERLKEERVRRVVEPVILGSENGVPRNDDDCRYVLDMGLLKEDEHHAIVPANPMYTEILLRYLSQDEQELFKGRYQTPFWLRPDGSLDMAALMSEFQKFWRENSESYHEVYGYKEAMPHLVIMAFLQRVVNGGGRIIREMALGSKRLDLCVEYKTFRYALELKMRRNFVRERSLVQFVEYLDHLGLDEGWMPVFDDDKSRSWDERLYNRDETAGGKTIHVVGL